MNNKQKVWTAISAFIVIVVFIVSIYSPKKQLPIEPVTLQLPWNHSASYAGFYVAENAGYYDEYGIDLTFSPGGPGIDTVEKMLADNSDFSLLIGAEIIRQRDIGNPLKAVACIYRKSPLVYISLADKNITHPRDLVGKTVRSSAQNKVVINALVSKFEGDPSTIIHSTTRNYNDLYTGKVDVWGGYSAVSLKRIQEDDGYQVNVINPNNFGVHFYYSCITTTDQKIKERPDMIKRFLEATLLKGWPKAFQDPIEAGELASNYLPDTQDPADHIARMLPLVDTGIGYIGQMEHDVWQYMITTLNEQGLLKTPLKPEDVYTSEFLDQIFDQ